MYFFPLNFWTQQKYAVMALKFNQSSFTIDKIMLPKGADRSANNVNDNLGPVVQSIISLTKLLGCQLVKYMLITLSNTLLVFLKKCENLFRKMTVV